MRSFGSPFKIKPRKGLTLVEVLVVLTVVGVVAAMVVLSVRSGGDEARIEANRFADRLRLAADEALIAGRPVTLTMNPTGYAFETDGVPVDDWGQRHELPQGVRLWAPQARLPIDPDGSDPAVTMTLRDGKRTWAIAFDGLNAVVSPARAEAA